MNKSQLYRWVPLYMCIIGIIFHKLHSKCMRTNQVDYKQGKHRFNAWNMLQRHYREQMVWIKNRIQAKSPIDQKVPVYWLWHAPAKIIRGGHFGVLKGMWGFSQCNCAQGNQLWKARDQNWACILWRQWVGKEIWVL